MCFNIVNYTLCFQDSDNKLLSAAENNVRKHLIKLAKEGKVLQSGEKWQVSYVLPTKVMMHCEVSVSNKYDNMTAYLMKTLKTSDWEMANAYRHFLGLLCY